jgi:hypothetical protein
VEDGDDENAVEKAPEEWLWVWYRTRIPIVSETVLAGTVGHDEERPFS